MEIEIVEETLNPEDYPYINGGKATIVGTDIYLTLSLGANPVSQVCIPKNQLVAYIDALQRLVGSNQM